MSKLEGMTILVPESRELDLFAGMLEAQGARAVRCPMVAILDVEDPAPALAWLDQLIAGAFDDLLLLTGEGLRRLLGIAERAGKKAAAIEAIGRLRIIVRGPKPTRALREVGLAPTLTAAAPTSAGVVETMSALDLRGRTIGVQYYAGEVDAGLIGFLNKCGAKIVAVTPYRYASASETDAVAAAIQSMAKGEIDVVAFTSSPQVKRMIDVAQERGLATTLAEAWRRTKVASIGPVVSDALRAHGIAVAAQPEAGFHLKPLVGAIAVLRNAK